MKISKANKGENHHMFGKVPFLEAFKKMSEAKKGEKTQCMGKTTQLRLY